MSVIHTSILCFVVFFFNAPPTHEFYTYCHTLSLHDALPIWAFARKCRDFSARSSAAWHRSSPSAALRESPAAKRRSRGRRASNSRRGFRSEEHTSELQSLMRISYAVFCLKKKKIR